MSILNYILLPRKGIIIISDSIASLPDGRPIRYVSKVFPLPHIHSVICGTGCLGPIIDWYAFILKHLTVRDIGGLNKVAPRHLRDIYAGYGSKRSATAIIQFGFIPEDGCYYGCAFRSDDGFSREELPPGIGLNPEHETATAFFRKIESGLDPLPLLIDICKQQKIRDDTLPPEKRLGIGGSLFSYTMVKKMCKMREIHVFNDKDDRFKEMLRNARSMGGELF